MSTRRASSNSDEILNMLAVQALYNYGFRCSFSDVKGKWDLNFNTFDLEFGRPYYNGKCLQFRAHYGLKGGWIDHTFDRRGTCTYSGIEGIYEANSNSKSWLVGPRAGIQTKWTFDDGFRFFGNAAASLFYQKFYKVSYKEPYFRDTNEWAYANDYSSQHISASLESLVGIGWGTYFDRNRWHFDLTIGYESQLFFNQNQMAVLKDFSIDYFSPYSKAGNLMFHGLNVTMQFDF